MTVDFQEPEGQPRRVFHPGIEPQAQSQEAEPIVESVEEPEDNPVEPEIRRMVGGRERTMDEIVAGYEASTAEAMRLKANLDAQRELAEAYRRMAQEAPRVEAPPSEYASLQEAGVNPSDMESLISRRVQEQLQEAFRPLVEVQQAAAKVKQGLPDFDPNVLQQRLLNDPGALESYNALLGQNPALAMQTAWKLTQSQATPAQLPPPAMGDLNGARTVQATPRRQAVQPDPAEDRAKRLAAAKQKWEETGDATDFYRVRSEGTSIDRRAEVANNPIVTDSRYFMRR